MTAPVVFHDRPQTGAVQITHPTRAGLLEDVTAHWQRGQGFTLATLNLDHIVKLYRDPVFRAAYLAQTHVVADGNPVVWLSRRAGRAVELVPGSELIAPLCALAARQDVPVALLGSTKTVLAETAAVLEKDHPGLRVVARLSPPYGFDVDSPAADAVLTDLAASGARLCFLALGAPKQERLAVRGAAACPQVGFVSIGAGLDFIAGHQKRAPAWVRRLALEWLWRMLGNPTRLAWRYASCFAILPGLYRQAGRDRQS